jgi:hypothetical protein
MITSDRQYQVAKDKLALLLDAVKSKPKSGLPAHLLRAAEGQTGELAAELLAEIREYEALKNAPKKIEIHSLEELFTAPTRYRLAQNLTIEQFAQKVNVHSRQIARYEKENYQNVASSTLRDIFNCLNIQLKGVVELKNETSAATEISSLRPAKRKISR